MKLDPTRLANALAILAALYYVICVFLVNQIPGVYFPIMRSWFHGIDFPASMMRKGIPVGLWLYGLVTFTAISWMTGYAFGAIYNKLGEKRK